MNEKQKVITFTGIFVLSIVSLNHSYKTIVEERAKREKIRQDTAKEISAMARACDIMIDRIRSGNYDRSRGIDGVMEDFTFYTIVNRTEQ